MQSAYANKTLIIEKAQDIDGLNFHHSINYNGDQNSTISNSQQVSETYDPDVWKEKLADGKHHFVIGFDTLDVFLSW